jgi:hypothetical protein
MCEGLPYLDPGEIAEQGLPPLSPAEVTLLEEATDEDLALVNACLEIEQSYVSAAWTLDRGQRSP